MSIATPDLNDSLLEIKGKVACLSFNRDDIRNALTGSALIDDLLLTLDWVNKQAEISVLILTGKGKAFSAGGNIKEMQLRDSDYSDGAFSGPVYEVQQKYRFGIQQIPLAMERCEVPIIAAINGPAIGAGFDLSCMCDIRLGCENTRLGETFLNLGIIPGDGGAWFLQRLVGYQRAAELTFSGRILHGEEALQLGLLLELCQDDQLMSRAWALAEQFSRQPPQALRMTKRLLKSANKMPLAEFLDQCALFQGICHNTNDHMEAVNGFVEKRATKYTGS